MKKKIFLTSFLWSLFFSVSAQPIIILAENFNTYSGTAATIPEGWTISRNTSATFYTTASNSGSSGPNSYKFEQTNSTITTPEFQFADSVFFWLRGNSTAGSASALTVSESADGINWQVIAQITPLPNSAVSHRYKVSKTSTRVRFVYTKDAGNLAFDDFSLTGLPIYADFKNDKGCLGNAVEFNSLSASRAGTISQWNWSFGDGAVSTLENPAHLYASAGTYPVKLVVNDDNLNVDSLTRFITVYEMPTANFTMSATELCLGESLELSSNSVVPIGESIGSFSWSFGDGTFGSSEQNPEKIYSSAGNFDISFTLTTANGGCSDTEIKSVFVKPAPIAYYSYQEDQLNFSFTSEASGNIVSHHWDLGDGNTSSNHNISHTFAADGFYDVCLSVTSDTGCSSVFCNSISVTGTFIKEIDPALSEIKIFPNPSPDGIFFIETDSKAIPKNYIVSNALGSILAFGSLNKGLSPGAIDLSELPKGSYFLCIQTEKGIVITKILKL
jgi:PKD repeat protein